GVVSQFGARVVSCAHGRGARTGEGASRISSRNSLNDSPCNAMLGRLVGRRGVLRLLAATAGLLAATLATAAWRWAHAPRVWKPREVAVAFWSWRAETPSQSDVERASVETRSRVLFMRAGQLDFSAGRVVRVRAVKGRAPANVEL